jgi:hypothetical protein
MRNFALILAGLLILVTTCTAGATLISETVGQYKISFSLPDEVHVLINSTVAHEKAISGVGYTDCNLKIVDSLNPLRTAALSVAQYERPVWTLAYWGNSAVGTMKGLGYMTVDSTGRIIDGHPGFLLVGNLTLTLPTAYYFGYLFDDRTAVIALSMFPWDNGSSQMLNALHIEKV